MPSFNVFDIGDFASKLSTLIESEKMLNELCAAQARKIAQLEKDNAKLEAKLVGQEPPFIRAYKTHHGI
jgi:hypothetical protein